jgi:hypothetical protein
MFAFLPGRDRLLPIQELTDGPAGGVVSPDGKWFLVFKSLNGTTGTGCGSIL